MLIPNNTEVNKIRTLASKLENSAQFMEVCGTHTVSAFRSGLHALLPENVRLLSGPGCPVCVTPAAYLDKALCLCGQPEVTVATFGDMMRVPATTGSLEHSRARGADVRMVYSPEDALRLAVAEPERKIVFLGVGFETTTPAVAWTIKQAHERSVPNYSVLCAHKTIPEAMLALFQGESARIDGFLCPGHVSVIIGERPYRKVCREGGVPCVIAGFEGPDMLQGIRMLLEQVLDGRADIENQYSRSVSSGGNAKAREICEEVLEKRTVEWRGIGCIPNSGLAIRERFSGHDAECVFSDVLAELPAPAAEISSCACGEVLKGISRPTACKLFANACTPVHPIGPCMVSSEGTCAAYYKYGRGRERKDIG